MTDIDIDYIENCYRTYPEIVALVEYTRQLQQSTLDKDSLIKLSGAAQLSAREAEDRYHDETAAYFRGQRDAYALLAAHVREEPVTTTAMVDHVCGRDTFACERCKPASTVTYPHHLSPIDGNQ